MRTCPFTGHSINVSSEKLISGPLCREIWAFTLVLSPMSEELEISAVSLMSAELVKSTVLSRLAMSVADELSDSFIKDSLSRIPVSEIPSRSASTMLVPASARDESSVELAPSALAVSFSLVLSNGSTS